MKKPVRSFALLILSVLILCMPCQVYAASAESDTATASTAAASTTTTAGAITGTTQAAVSIPTTLAAINSKISSGAVTLTLEEAVALGIYNSIALKQVQSQIDMSKLVDDQADSDRTDLIDGATNIVDARKDIASGKNKISSAQTRINAANTLLSNGKAPEDITVSKSQTGLPVDIKISAGDDIYDTVYGTVYKIIYAACYQAYLTSYGDEEKAEAAVAATAKSTSAKIADTVENAVQDEIDASQEEVDAGRDKLSSAADKLSDGIEDLADGLEKAREAIADKLNTQYVNELSLGDATNLIVSMADTNYNVTQYAQGIYRNQIAMLIEKNYYDALKAKKVVEVKQKSVDRASKQQAYAEASYKEGMVAKDDMLLAGIYLNKTRIELRKAQSELENTMTELKKNLCFPFIAKLGIVDDTQAGEYKVKLEDALKTGAENRLEIKKALAQQTICKLYLDSVKNTYVETTFQYKEAANLKQQADLNLSSVQQDVESSIRESYETAMSAEDMLALSKDMTEKAKETLEIAEYKYKEGFSVENSLLKQMNLESMAGTMVEVLSAEENLSQVEEAEIEVTYGFKLAGVKYMNDAGRMIF